MTILLKTIAMETIYKLSHSQGTHHSIRLLAEQIDGTDLYPRMIGAYIIGGEISKSWLKKMEDIYICDGPKELKCLVHWDTIKSYK